LIFCINYNIVAGGEKIVVRGDDAPQSTGYRVIAGGDKIKMQGEDAQHSKRYR